MEGLGPDAAATAPDSAGRVEASGRGLRSSSAAERIKRPRTTRSPAGSGAAPLAAPPTAPAGLSVSHGKGNGGSVPAVALVQGLTERAARRLGSALLDRITALPL